MTLYSNNINNDFLLDVSRGLIPGFETFHRFGSNDTVGITIEDVWTYGGVYTWPTTAETLQIQAGGNAADAAAGAGARTVEVEFLDASWNRQTEILTLAGAAASAATILTARRLIRAKVLTTGTYSGANTGDITIENSTSNQVVGSIQALHGQTQMTMYTVPLGFSAYLIQYNIAVGLTNTATVHMYQRTGADIVAAPFGPKQVVGNINEYSGATQTFFNNLPVFPEKTDLWWEAKKITGGGNAEIAVSYDLILVDNTL